MVEQEYPKNSTSFPESLTVNNSSQHSISKSSIVNNVILGTTEDFRNASDELYNDLSMEEFLCPDFKDNIEIKDDLGVQDALLSDEMSPFSFNSEVYNDKYVSYTDDYWQPLSERNSSVSDPYFEATSPLSFWGSSPVELETLKMDDVFQVDKDDIVQGPTLAELNANDESLIDSFDSFDIPVSVEQRFEKSVLSDINEQISKELEKTVLKQECEVSVDKTKSRADFSSSYIEEESISNSDGDSDVNLSHTKTNSSSDSDNKELLSDIKVSKSVISAHKPKTEVISDKKVKTLPKSSNDKIYESEDDSEMDCEYSSDDNESDDDIKIPPGKQIKSKNLLKKKKSRYFWQYNIQSKGPKVPKVKLDGKSKASEGFSKISDPVFSAGYHTSGIQHAGKARRGDGNDLTPNPQKLYNIGLELEKLTAVIDGLVPANELPEDARPDSRKEKNKLASRACRLKKKAQHEANKLKLYGLQKEQKHLLSFISDARKIILKTVSNMKKDKNTSVQEKIEEISAMNCYTKVAGCSAEFVNKVLKNVDLGDKTGGLDIEPDTDY